MLSKGKAHLSGRVPSASASSPTIFFYRPWEQPYGIFSQWYTCTMMIPTSSLQFLTTDAPATTTATPTSSSILAKYGPSLTFSCAEQFFMFCKALYFSDSMSCNKILASKDPKVQKRLGRQVKGYNEYRWTKVKSRVARVGNWYKFAQTGPTSETGRNAIGKNPAWKSLRDVLLDTGEKELAEASDRDMIWGIGFLAAGAEEMRGEWGENRLGKALMAVRARLAEVVGNEGAGEAVMWEWDGEMEGEDVE